MSGTGEELGTILGIEHDASGAPVALLFLEAPGAAPRRVEFEFIRHVEGGRVRLAGPREGYHIARLHR